MKEGPFSQKILGTGKFLFTPPPFSTKAVAGKKWNEDAIKVLTSYTTALGDLSTFDALIAKTTLETVTTALVLPSEKFAGPSPIHYRRRRRSRPDDSVEIIGKRRR